MAIDSSLAIKEDEEKVEASRWSLGSSLTYIPMSPELPSGAHYLYNEWTWSLNAAYDHKAWFRAGFNNMTIHTRSPISGKRFFWIGGSFFQFDLLPRVRSRLYPEVSLNIGNYCTCGDGEPYRNGFTLYLGWGIGGNLALSKRWDLDLSFISYQNPRPTQGSYAFTQYVIGLDYRFMASFSQD